MKTISNGANPSMIFLDCPYGKTAYYHDFFGVLKTSFTYQILCLIQQGSASNEGCTNQGISGADKGHESGGEGERNQYIEC